jgi:hypothetical protein
MSRDYEVLHGAPLVEKLNDLIQLDFDAIVSYNHAIEHCDDERARRDLELFRGDHYRHIHDLNRVILMLDGKPIDMHRDLKGLVLEGITTVRSLGGTLPALRAMRTNEKLTNRTYRKAAELALAPIARIAIDQNYADEIRHLSVIQAHIERLSGTAVITPSAIPVVPVDQDPALRRDR